MMAGNGKTTTAAISQGIEMTELIEIGTHSEMKKFFIFR